MLTVCYLDNCILHYIGCNCNGKCYLNVIYIITHYTVIACSYSFYYFGKKNNPPTISWTETSGMAELFLYKYNPLDAYRFRYQDKRIGFSRFFLKNFAIKKRQLQLPFYRPCVCVGQYSACGSITKISESPPRMRGT